MAAVAEFLETDVREGTTGAVNFHARVAANVLRTVERELLDDTADEPRAALARAGSPTSAALSAAIRRGELDDRGRRGPAERCGHWCCHRLAVAHPGYEHE